MKAQKGTRTNNARPAKKNTKLSSGGQVRSKKKTKARRA